MIRVLFVAAVSFAVLCCVGASNETTDVGNENPENCSFYCFVTPQRKTRFNESDYHGLACTHFVYGFANVRRDNSLSDPSLFDRPTYTDQGNYRKFTRMNRQKSVKSLLGIRQARELTFLDDDFASSKFAELVVDTARTYHFDGLYLYFEGNHYHNFHFQNFLKVLSQKVDEGASSRAGSSRLFLVLAIPAKRVRAALQRLNSIERHFDTLYLVSDAISSADDSFVAVHLQPLYSSTTVPATDSVSASAGKLVDTGVDPKKIVVGLSIWARSYTVEDTSSAGHLKPAEGFGTPGNRTQRHDGRLSYAEICKKLRNKSRLVYDSKSASLSTTDSGGQWYSFEMPKHESFKKKINWISKQGFGGIGISTVDADDVGGVCGEGRYPFHTFAHKQARCGRRKKRALRDPCSRLCVLEPNRSETQLKVESLPAGSCTHLVISSASVQQSSVEWSERARGVLSSFQDLESDEKPLLLLTFGAELSSKSWRSEIQTAKSREAFANNVKGFAKENEADGVVVAWTSEPLQSLGDKDLLANFLTQLRKTLTNTSLIAIAVHPKSSFFGFYDIPTILRTVDFVIVEGHRFLTSGSAVTGHPSAMFSNSKLLTDPKQSVEALAKDWVSRGVPASKLIIGFSAVGIKQQLENFDGIDDKGNLVKLGTKSLNGLQVSQSEICELQNDRSSVKSFPRELGVPFLVRDTTFVAYEDAESARIKTLWASLNDFGGMAVYGLEADNPDGTCPKDAAFPILRSVFDAHICKRCPTATNSKCRPPVRVACPYRLPDENDSDPLRPYELPFDRCTEIVVEEAILDQNMKLGYRDTRATSNMQLLMTLLPKLGDKGLISAIRCKMSKSNFNRMLSKDQRSSFVSKLMGHVKKFGFTGVELKCDDMLDSENKQSFKDVLNDLLTQINSAKDSGKCPKTVSIRIPAWRKSLQSAYDIPMLNSLDRVVLEPFHVQSSRDSTPLTSPLFPLSGTPDELSIATTIKAWTADGLQPGSILLQIPTYGTARKLASPEKNSIGDLVLPNERQILRQKEMCSKRREKGYREKLDYGTVAGYATTPAGEWISYETQKTILAKIRYVLREGLAGIGMMTVNEDDNKNSCSQGDFPLLSAITRVLRACAKEEGKKKSANK